MPASQPILAAHTVSRSHTSSPLTCAGSCPSTSSTLCPNDIRSECRKRALRTPERANGECRQALLPSGKTLDPGVRTLPLWLGKERRTSVSRFATSTARLLHLRNVSRGRRACQSPFLVAIPVCYSYVSGGSSSRWQIDETRRTQTGMKREREPAVARHGLCPASRCHLNAAKPPSRSFRQPSCPCCMTCALTVAQSLREVVAASVVDFTSIFALQAQLQSSGSRGST